jgi:pilus assembly protein CpaB
MPQESRKAFLIALAFAALGVALGYLYLRRYEQELSGGERVAVLTLLKDVSPGETIRETMLAVREIPTAYIDDRNVLAKDKDKVVGIDTVIPIRNQQTLQWTDLAVRSDIRNLSSLVSPGKRAFTVSAPRAEATGNKLIRPGDRVDVIATLPSSGADGGHRSLLLLQKILVVAVGLRTDRLSDSDEKGGYRRDDSALTLSLDVDEAQLLALAQAQGQVSVAVRNPEDALTYSDLLDLDSASMVRARDDLRARRSTSPARPSGPVRIGGE